MDKRSNKSAEGAFQQYTVIRENLAIPASMPYEAACVLPLCLSTAACALYQKDYLALQPPSANPTPDDEILLIWGGSTSVGKTWSKGGLGLEDSNSHTRYHRGSAAPTISWAIAIGNRSIQACIAIIGASNGKKFVARASVDWPEKMPQNTMGMIELVFSFVWSNISTWFTAKRKGVATKFIFGSDLMANEVSQIINEDFLPFASANGKYHAVPEPQIVGKGLEHVQEALDLNMKGVSAKRVVVSL
ncbi:MAG: hypothetical protein Q9170_003922 [Blastenia crenularia]